MQNYVTSVDGTDIRPEIRLEQIMSLLLTQALRQVLTGVPAVCLALLLVLMLAGAEPKAVAQTVSFSAPSAFQTGTGARSVAMADLNGDGKLDLAVTNASVATVSVLLGSGTGSFGTKTDFSTGVGPAAVAVGDFNGDGKLDLAIANANSSTVSVLLGTGTGSFGTKTDFATGSGPISLISSDFNGDGKLDLAAANYSGPTVSILLGTGTGSFGPKSDFTTGTGPYFVTTGDFNRDGKLDLATSNQASNSVSVLLGTGAGTFGSKTDFGTGSSPQAVVTCDFNGDGILDLATSNNLGDSVSVLSGTGTGSFGTKTDFGVGDGPYSLVAGDLNNDGKFDLATVNTFSKTVSILPGTGTGAFGAKTDFVTETDLGVGGVSFSVAAGDLNGDGTLDLATANLGSANTSVLLNTTPIPYRKVYTSTDFGAGTNPRSVADGDFDGDGKLDLAVANANGSSVSILLGTGTGSFGTKADFGTGFSPFSVATGDFNNDGKLDLAVANAGNTTVSILLGTGTGTFGAKTDFATGDSPSTVAVGDFNVDGKLDLVTANYGSDTVSILLGTGTGSFGTKTDFGTASHPYSVAVGDFNRDGKLDLAVANYFSNTVSILLGAGTGTFGTRSDFSTGSFPYSIKTGDFNSDGQLDLATANAVGDTVSILLGTGAGTFGTNTEFGTGGSPTSVAVGDLNGDGKLDLMVATYAGNSVSILLGTGTGTFGTKTDFGTGGGPYSVATGDFNRDGKLDLATANWNGNTASVLLNNSAPPDLTVTKSHTGNFIQGQTGAQYTITVTNSGAGLVLAGDTVTVADTLPVGLTATSASGTGWSCVLGPNVTCMRGDALAPAASYPAITLTVDVAGNAPASVTNTVTVSGGGDGNVANNSASDPTVIGSLFSINNASAVKPSSGTASMLFTVSLSAPAGATTTVHYATADGSALAGTDYLSVPDTLLTFNPGEQFKTLPVTIIGGSPSPDRSFTVVLSNPSLGSILTGVGTGTIRSTRTPGQAVISELRTSGPGGAGDDFVEIYNNSGSPLTVHANDGSGSGWAVVKSGASCDAAPQIIGVIPENTVIPAKGHYLLTGSAYSLGSGDQTLLSDIESDANIGLFSASGLGAISSANRLDAVGFGGNTGGNCDLLREGNTLPTAIGSTSEHSYVRKLLTGIPQDTDYNQSDFVLVSTTPDTAVGSTLTPVLGTPGPENIFSPVQRNGELLVPGLIEPGANPTVAPNRVRTLGTYTDSLSGTGTYPQGRLAVRRSYTNNTGEPITQLRFRIVDITAGPAPAGTADTRAISSPGQVSVTTSRGTFDIVGTTLETPPVQPNGGGINSTLSVGTITLGTPLNSGETVYVEWLLGLKQGGNFRFAVNVEALQAGF